ncbi:MAG TPA: 50S ribosomal protein L35 [bacterium]|nr:50S ribosomal protein L35 [bacterium]HPJ71321.1 50S ribosomal protein L35 [bacterium]HPQ66188.1 50S ribosomal protein L35 [bacterium]
MPKLKTNKGVQKRFKVTKSGKVKNRRSGKSHLLTGKSRKRKRRLRSAEILSAPETKKVLKQLPYA